MRRMIPLVAILLALFAGAATAEIGLVADIDGDYTNGPDTLLADPGDTVQVNVWITGDDSLVAFGVTLGDTSGALVWIEEPESLVYTTPSGWANVPVPQDSLGWLMVQSTDFTGSVPLILPSKVAEMDFVVAPGQSCGAIVFDPAMSGWQNWSLHEGEYASSEPVTCPSNEGEEQSSSPGGPDGGGDSSDNDNDLDAGEGGSATTPTTFSRSLAVPDEDYLFVQGHRIRGHVLFTWSIGEPMMANGYQVIPPPGNPAYSTSIAERQERFHQQPYVLRRVERGWSWSEAIHSFNQSLSSALKTAHQAYHGALVVTGNRDSARDAFSASISSADHGMFPESAAVTWLDDCVVVTVAGFPYGTTLYEEDLRSPLPAAGSTFPAYAQVYSLVQLVEARLSSPGPSLSIFPSVGGVTLLGGRQDFDEAVLSQIRLSQPNNIVEGEISESALAEIISCGGLEQ